MLEPALEVRRGRYANAPVVALNSPHTTRWFNFGFWEEGDDFASACGRLANAAGNAAGIRSGDRVLDVGCGAGESCEFWRTRFGARSVVGVEAERGQLAQRRPDASFAAVAARGQALPLRSGSIDRVVAVDAAYHFDSREDFFAEARRCLRSGGRMALCDIMLARNPGPVIRAAAGLSAYVAGIPRANQQALPAYRESLTRSGFGNIEVACIEDSVFPGFRAFARRRASLGRPGLLGVRLAAEGLEWLRARGVVRFAVVSAEARGAATSGTVR